MANQCLNFTIKRVIQIYGPFKEIIGNKIIAFNLLPKEAGYFCCDRVISLWG